MMPQQPTKATHGKPMTHTASKPAEVDTPHNITPKERQHSKAYSILEGSLNSITVGLTSNFVSAFAIALGSSNTIIAMVSTLPSLIGAILQLGVRHVRGFFSSRKRHIITFAVLQALMWLPLIFAPELQHPGGWLLLFVTLNTVFGMLISPVWNSWMGDIVEEDERGSFFGKRNMFTGLTAFIATIIAGWLLTVTKPGHPLVGFGILFALACAFRLMSAYFLSKMSDPVDTETDSSLPDIPEFIRTADRTPLGRFTIFLMLFNIAVYIASPFFAVYQLSVLGFDYFTFTIIACASAIASFVTMIFWGKYVDRLGSKNVLLFCGLLIPFVPLFWTLTTNPVILVFIEAFSGVVWAGFNLSVSTYLFDATDRKYRTRELAEYTLMIQVAVFIGAMAGSALLGIFDRTDPHAYMTIFTISFVLRMLIVIIFYNAIRELRIVEIPVKDRVFKKFIAVRPHHGIIYEPAVENVRAAKQAGAIAKAGPKQIDEAVESFVKRTREKNTSPLKVMERKEDERDFQEYKKKLK